MRISEQKGKAGTVLDIMRYPVIPQLVRLSKTSCRVVVGNCWPFTLMYRRSAKTMAEDERRNESYDKSCGGRKRTRTRKKKEDEKGDRRQRKQWVRSGQKRQEEN